MNRSLLPCALALGVLVCEVPAAAQAPRTIRVIGRGAASASPHFAEAGGTLAASGDTADKAIASYREKKDKLEKLLADAKTPGLQVEFRGEKLAASAAGDDAAAGIALPLGLGDGGGKFGVSETVVIRLPIENDMERTQAIKKLSGEIDRLGKAGIDFSGAASALAARIGLGSDTAIVQFGIEQVDDLRARAHQAAFSDARRRGENLAKLAGGKLGRVVSIVESASAEEMETVAAMQMQVYSAMFGGDAQLQPNSIDHNGKIELTQQLEVTFELTD